MDAVRMIMEAECKCEHGSLTVGECAKILAPLHDVEPVVRCKDCTTAEDCTWHQMRGDPEWFCADGKRKEG